MGISLPLSGPAAGLGIPMQNHFKLCPTSIAGEKLTLIILDDATDPSKGVQNARKFVTDDKVDLMKKQGVKTIGFLGYTDAYGEQWLKAFSTEGEKNGIKVIAAERVARSDSSVTAQALKPTAANPEAMLILASGSGAAMPEKAIVERGYKGRIFQIHAAATKDLMRIGGKDVEGTSVVSGPAVVGDLLPDNHPSKKLAMDFVAKYDKVYGAGSHNQFAGHAYDLIVLEKVVPVALKKAKPGCKEFRAALKDALEGMGRTVLAHGVMNWSATNHWGYTQKTGVMLVDKNGDGALAN